MSFKQIFSFALLLFAVTVFVSCDKEEPEEMEMYEQGIESNSALGLINQQGGNANNSNSSSSTDCITISYPITIIFPDGSTSEVNSDDELESAIETWYVANPDSDDDPTVEFPIEVTLEDGTTESINDEDTLYDLLEACYEDDDDDDDDDDGDDNHDDCDFDEYEDCFELNFPVTVILPDGNSVVTNDYDELETAIEDFYDANPDIDEDPTFSFPIEVTLDDGTVQSIADEAALEILFEACEDFEEDDECFVLVFPISFTLADGTMHTVNSEEEAEDIIDAFEDANPDLDDDPELQFPIDLILEDGTTVTVNSDEELEDLEDECDD